MLTAITDVMNEAQALINEQGKGFKGFLPAIFARLVATNFNTNMEGKMIIKLTAPKKYVRNRKNRPDKWEDSIIQTKFMAADYTKGQPFAENDTHKGKPAYRYILPEYYKESCLGCHGENIKPELLQLLDKHYPLDQARGFREGDLRGAFTLSRALAP